tara:strand:- start:133090 stop:133935 length:846 start_codon:yes stop_codon:yes gene_type:complete
MIQFSLIVLSKTDSIDIYEMNKQCFNTFVKSVKYSESTFEIILIESNEEAKYDYLIPNLKIITPKEDFNFHKFLNIGINEATGNYYILSNNDVVYSENWIDAFNKAKKKNKNILSFSPYDSKSNKLPKSVVQENELVLGYEIQKHLTGWCIITDEKVFDKIKKLDERFNFYYADYDYAMQLQKYNVQHALVTNAKVSHLESVSYHQENSINYDQLPKETPKYLIKENWTWVLKDKKMVAGLIMFHKKWGTRKSIKIKLFIVLKLKIIGFGFLNRFILTSKN